MLNVNPSVLAMTLQHPINEQLSVGLVREAMAIMLLWNEFSCDGMANCIIHVYSIVNIHSIITDAPYHPKAKKNIFVSLLGLIKLLL